MAAIQLDDVSLHARELIEALREDLAKLGDQDQCVSDAARRLLSWDGKCGADSVEAAIFHVFHHRLLVNLLTPDLGEELFAAYVEILNQSIAPTDRILGEANSLWFAGSSRFEIIARSLREACSELAAALGSDSQRWHWGRIHRLQMNHAFGRIGILRKLLGIGPVEAPGDGMTVNLGFYRHSNPYTQTVGAALRFLVELGATPRSEFVLASGQSGHATSRHYRDQFELWRDGKKIPLSDFPAESAHERHLLLKPV